jgi:YggT family protein
MSDSYLTNPVVFLVQTLVGLYTAVVVIRFLLQIAKADFYNPISQFVVKVTTPALRPLRRVIPGYRGLDLSSLVLAWLLKSAELALLAVILGLGRNPLGALAWSIPALAALVLNIYLFAILIKVILSWVNPDPYNPALSLIDKLTRPVLDPAQRLVPHVGGLDLAPMVAMIALVLIEMLLLPPLKLLSSSPF